MIEKDKIDKDKIDKDNKTIKVSTTFGILWNGFSQFLTQTFQIIVVMILARLLTPKDFGIAGLATVFIGLVAAFNELGLSAAIIQRKNISQDHLSTSFWANIFMAIILFLIFALISPFLADFFKEDMIEPILIVSSLGLIIGSFGIVHKTLLEKNMNFKKITMIEVFAGFISGTISIILALKGFGVWSIIAGSLSNSIISIIMLWRISDWRPTLKFSYLHFKELFKFGGNVMGSKLVGYIAMKIDYLIVGKILGTTSLGFYSVARNLTSFPVQKISWTIMRVIFPAFSSIQENNNILVTGYLKVIRYISLITFPMLAGMFVVAPEFVLIFYGEKWTPIIILLQILAIEAAMVSIGTITNTIQYAKGRSDLQFKWQTYTTVTLPVAIIVGATYGVVGVAVALTVMMGIYIYIIQYITNRLIGLKMTTFIKEMIPATVCSIILVIGVELFKIAGNFDKTEIIYMFISSILIGMAIYILLIKTFYSHIFGDVISLFKEMKGKVSRN